MEMQRTAPPEPCPPVGRDDHGSDVAGESSHGYGMMVSTSRMPEACQNLIAFADGELDDEGAAVFRMHLATCETCQTGLVEAMQLSARLSELKPRTRT
jgi:putative zinc finger protein